jgi:stage II sporulation protein M
MKKKRVSGKKLRKKQVSSSKKNNKTKFLLYGSLFIFLVLIINNLLAKILGYPLLDGTIKSILWVLVLIGAYGYIYQLGSPFSKSFSFIKESKKFIYIIIGLFLLFALIGMVVPTPDFIKNMITEFIKNILEQTKDLSLFGMIKFIFFNNLQSSFSGMIFGCLIGIFPILVSVVNGYLLGFVSLVSIKQEGILVLWKLFPHGIFELPAVFISLALGLRLGVAVFQKDKKRNFFDFLISSIRVFLFVILPLLVIAAIIEGCLILVFG